MVTIEIDTDKDWEDVGIQVRELETHELMSIYKLFVDNPTLFQLVSDELDFRRRHERKLEHDDQTADIDALMHRP